MSHQICDAHYIDLQLYFILDVIILIRYNLGFYTN